MYSAESEYPLPLFRHRGAMENRKERPARLMAHPLARLCGPVWPYIPASLSHEGAGLAAMLAAPVRFPVAARLPGG